MDDLRHSSKSKVAASVKAEMQTSGVSSVSLSAPTHTGTPAGPITVQRDISFVDERILARLQCYDLRDRVLSQDQFIRGMGSFSDVFKGICLDTEGKRMNVAMKRLRIHVNVEEYKRLFEKEIYVWSTLEHANVLPFLGYAFDANTGYPMLISEWMDNGNTLSYVRTCDPSIERIAEILCDAAKGMAYLHKRGVIHSDIKPENIVIDLNGVALLCDFGCARTQSATYSIAAPSRTVKGTCNYWAPELLEPQVDVLSVYTAHTDIWAFGMTIYALYTQNAPYQNCLELGVFKALIGGELPVFPSDSFESKKYALLKRICSRCWNRQPPKRPDAASIVDELQRVSVSRSRVVNDSNAPPLAHVAQDVVVCPPPRPSASRNVTADGDDQFEEYLQEQNSEESNVRVVPSSPTPPSSSSEQIACRSPETDSAWQRFKSTITKRISKSTPSMRLKYTPQEDDRKHTSPNEPFIFIPPPPGDQLTDTYSWDGKTISGAPRIEPSFEVQYSYRIKMKKHRAPLHLDMSRSGGPHKINDLLLKGSSTIVHYDVRLPESFVRKLVSGHLSPLLQGDSCEPALYPPVQHLRIYIDAFSEYYIDVHPKRRSWAIIADAGADSDYTEDETYVTVDDVLKAVRRSLLAEVKAENPLLETSDPRIGERLGKAVSQRRQLRQTMVEKYAWTAFELDDVAKSGILFVDYLRSRHMFAGFELAIEQESGIPYLILSYVRAS